MQGSTPKPHAVIIGRGFGGLAAAIRLEVRGYQVTVLEKLDAPGGRAYVFRLGGFTFDAGPTVVTAPMLLEQLWTLVGKRMSDDIDMRPVTPFYRIRFHDGTLFDYTGNPEAMRREVERLSPRDVEGYEEFIRTNERIFHVGFEELAHVPFGGTGALVCGLVKLIDGQGEFDAMQRFGLDLQAFGAAFGMELVLTQSVFFRPHNKSEDVEGLYIVGAGTHPGAGLPGVLSSARVLDSVVPHANALR